jgi:tRNA pseudouridine(55) synthase
MNKNIHIINKKEGETPLFAMEEYRKEKGILKEVSLTYAGRLDPMASGLLIVLEGDEVFNKEKYNNLKKTYKFQILFGFSTDTGDILGKVKNHKSESKSNISEEEIQKILKSFIGKQEQNYPMYSSKTVKGIPLWQYARENLDLKEIPKHEIEIFDLKLNNFETKKGKDILLNIENRIKKLSGDFRQEEIINSWKETLKDFLEQEFVVAECVADVSSGTYIRVLSESIGEKLNTQSLAFSIERIQIGEYKI